MDESFDITAYSLLNKRMTGCDLKLFFGLEGSDEALKVLELQNIVAFSETFSNQKYKTIEIRGPAGSYGLDISIRLKRPEIKIFKEVFVWNEGEQFRSFSFRALAEKVIWRDHDHQSYKDLNY